MGIGVASGTPINGYSLVLNRPLGTTGGDLLVAFVASDGAGITLQAPGGWVDLGGASVGTASSGRTVRAFYRYATNAEPASYTFNSSSTNAYRVCAVRVVDAPLTNPIAVPATWLGAAQNAASLPVPVQTTPAAGLQLAFASANSPSAWTFGTPAGFTQLTRANDSNNATIAWRATDAGSTPSGAVFDVGVQLFSWITGSVVLAGGRVISVTRSARSLKTLQRTATRNPTGRSIVAAGATQASRVVVRSFFAVIGGGVGGSNPDAFEEPFTDSFAASDAGILGGSLVRGAQKNLGGSSAPTSPALYRVALKTFSAATGGKRFLRKGVIVFRGGAIPATGITIATNIGRLFGIPGVIDMTVRLVGEVTSRVRRR